MRLLRQCTLGVSEVHLLRKCTGCGPGRERVLAVSVKAHAPLSAMEVIMPKVQPEPVRDPQGDHLLTPQNSAIVFIDFQPGQ